MFNENHKLEKMFSPLSKLQYLDLSSTNIVKIPLMKSFVNLKRYYLADNKIRELNRRQKDFKNLKSLRTLVLAINETSFPKKVLKSLKTIDLSGNPFICNCDLLWFTEWIKTTNATIANYPMMYKCDHPTYLNEINYINAKKSCPPWNPFYTLAIVLSVSGLIFVSFFVTIFKCQVNIKNLMYLTRLRRKGYLPLLANDDFEFDAFVVHCDEDQEWVHNNFVHNIENKGFKLCIHERDFDIGQTITDNVAKYLEKSSKVIVVMSNEFTKSDWCQWEVDVVLERLRNYGPDVFLLIMIKPVHSKHMTSKLRSILQCTPCLMYKTGLGENMFWNAVIKAISKPIGHSPIA